MTLKVHVKLGISEEELYRKITDLWLNGLTDLEIAKTLNVHCSTIYKIRHDIIHLANRGSDYLQRRELLSQFSFTNYQCEVLDGLLLGDGSLDRVDYPSPRYKHGTSKKETLDVIVAILDLDYKSYTKSKPKGVVNVKGNMKDINERICYEIHTKAYPQLKTFANRWYMKNPDYHENIGWTYKNRKFIKIVPDDLILTPTVCYWWYIGDGSLPHKINANGKLMTNVLSLSTDSFTDKERQKLINLMKEYINVQKVASDSRGKLYLHSIDIPKFLDYIGPCKNPEYAYKWDYIKPKFYISRKSS